MQENVQLKQEITRLNETIESYRQGMVDLKQHNDIQNTLNEILNISLMKVSLNEQMRQILLVVLNIPWLTLDKKGCVFLVDESGNGLNMVAHHNLGESLLNMCNKIQFGQCLCGKAAREQELIFRSCIDDDHEFRPEGIQPHGHYNMPIVSEGTTLGVLNLYVKHGHTQSKLEQDFLQVTAKAMANIIERKKTENELQQIKDTLDQTLDCIFMFDANSLKFTYVNEGALRQVGYSRDELMTMHPFDIKPDFTEMEFREFIAPMLAGERVTINFETIHQHKNGQHTPVEIFLQYIAEDQAHFVAIVSDITERKSTETELAHHRAHLEELVQQRTVELQLQNYRNDLILDTAIDGFIAVNMEGRILEANPAYCEMLGYTREELLQIHIPELEAVESLEETAAHFRRIIALGHDRFDTRQRCKGGSLVDVEISVTLVDFGDKKIFYAFIRDISERKFSEQQLILARDESERANAAKSEFLSRMSHELRTPLNAILGFGQLLELDTEHPLTEQQTNYALEIIHSGSHLLELVNEVLDLSRIESGHLSVSLTPVRVAPLIESCVAQIQPLAEAHAIRTTLEVKNEFVVLADQTRLKQVLLNLLSNAIKYNHEGGSILLECVVINDERLRINVRDSGRGIAAEAIPRLFRPFERIESAYDGIDGTGIGLALTKNLVEAMHGDIGVESVPGEGSTFWFELPLSSTSETTTGIEATPITVTASSGTRSKVLYVEDNPSNLRLVQSVLAPRADIELLDAGNAEDGLDIATDQIPALILLDINLPGMDGYEALRQLQANALTRHIPVIAISANAMRSDIESGKAAGFAEYITKPIDIAELIKLIDKILGGNIQDRL